MLRTTKHMIHTKHQYKVLLNQINNGIKFYINKNINMNTQITITPISNNINYNGLFTLNININNDNQKLTIIDVNMSNYQNIYINTPIINNNYLEFSLGIKDNSDTNLIIEIDTNTDIENINYQLISNGFTQQSNTLVLNDMYYNQNNIFIKFNKYTAISGDTAFLFGNWPLEGIGMTASLGGTWYLPSRSLNGIIRFDPNGFWVLGDLQGVLHIKPNQLPFIRNCYINQIEYCGFILAINCNIPDTLKNTVFSVNAHGVFTNYLDPVTGDIANNFSNDPLITRLIPNVVHPHGTTLAILKTSIIVLLDRAMNAATVQGKPFLLTINESYVSSGVQTGLAFINNTDL